MRQIATLTCALVLMLGAAHGANPKAAVERVFQSIEIVRFSIEPELGLPDDYLVALENELAEQLRRIKNCQLVVRETGQVNPPEPVLRLTGVVKQFEPGSRSKRYLGGFGSGKTKIVAHIKLVDKGKGEVVLEESVDGKVVGGFLGGDSMSVARELAKEITKLVRKRFFP